MPKKPTDYSKSIIYKICCKDPSIKDIYVGHTTQFIKRKYKHKCSCNNENNKNYNCYVYEFIREHGNWDNWSMIQIEEISCNNKREAEQRENYWINELQATLNSQKSFNTKKQYYEQNKDKIKEYIKEYQEQNKEKIIEQKKQYYEHNKEKIIEQRKQYYEHNKEKIKQYYQNKKLSNDILNEEVFEETTSI